MGKYNLKRLTFSLVLGWTLIIILILSWNIYYEHQQIREIALIEARAFFNKDQAFRHWATSHGGVYVRATDRTPPNPHLKHIPERDIVTPSGVKLTLMNPAYMLRQLMDDYHEMYNVHGRIVSLKPLRRQNEPDQWERNALLAFEKGTKEIAQFTESDNKHYLRLIQPMFTQKGCLKCHAFQGYHEGDVRGGVGISLDLSHLDEKKTKTIIVYSMAFLFVWVIGMGGIVTGMQRLRLYLKREDESAHSLMESEERYRTLVDNMPGVVFRVAPHASREVLYMSKGLSEITGYAAGQGVAGKEGELRDIIFADDIENVMSVIDDAVKEGHPYSLEYRVRHRSGETRWVLERGQAVYDGKDPLWIDGILFDISKRKSAETEKAHLESLLHHDEKLKAIGQLAGGIAHDFNNQLAGIMGYTEILSGKLDSALTWYTGKILTIAKRSAELVRQLLSFARLNSYKEENIDIHLLLHDVAELLRHTIDRRIEVKEEFYPGHLVVCGGSSHLQNAFLNLGLNARDAMSEGGVLSFRTSLVNVRDYFPGTNDMDIDDDAYACISIEDTGCGMSYEVQKHLFEPFFTTKDVGKGTGMGLAAVYGSVKQHRGMITVESREGVGTVFNIFLPLREISVEEPVIQPAYEPGDVAPMRILVVDDEEMNRDFITILLEERGHSVQSAMDGREALAIYRSGHDEIDLVILDMIMPGMDGHECLAEMRRINPGVRVIIISGFSYGNALADLIDKGASGVVRKPFEKALLLQEISRVMRSS